MAAQLRFNIKLIDNNFCMFAGWRFSIHPPSILQSFLEDAENPPEVWAHETLEYELNRYFTVSMTGFRRAMRQFGVLIPAHVNSGIGPALRAGIAKGIGILYPDHFLDEDEKDVKIAGKTLLHSHSIGHLLFFVNSPGSRVQFCDPVTNTLHTEWEVLFMLGSALWLAKNWSLEGQSPSTWKKYKNLVFRKSVLMNWLQSMHFIQTASGLDVKLVHIPGETDDQIGVYIPSMDAFLCADDIYKAFPNLYAIRGTPHRDLMQWVYSIDKIRRLKPEYLVPSHTRHVVGKEKIYTLLTEYRDAIQMVHDQTVR